MGQNSATRAASCLLLPTSQPHRDTIANEPQGLSSSEKGPTVLINESNIKPSPGLWSPWPAQQFYVVIFSCVELMEIPEVV